MTLINRYGIHVMAVEEYSTAGIPDDETRKMIGLKGGSPVIIIERIAFSTNESRWNFGEVSAGRIDTTIESDCKKGKQKLGLI